MWRWHLPVSLQVGYRQSLSGKRGHFNLQKQLQCTLRGGHGSGNKDQGITPLHPVWVWVVAWPLPRKDSGSYLGGDCGGRAGHKTGDSLAAAGRAGSRSRGGCGQSGGYHGQWQEARSCAETAGCAAPSPGGDAADAGGPVGAIDAPLTAVPAHAIISFEAAVVPGHLGGPWQLLTGNQSPDLRATEHRKGVLAKTISAWPREVVTTSSGCSASALGPVMGFSNTPESQQVGESLILCQPRFSADEELAVQEHTAQGNKQDLNPHTLK